ncbi:hypothetical protein SERLADRAFT_468448 [Serpula lacrymans var. lacrymans S7.9]|nr:uncharacterized protein SERLADRAFT_468448 [Serpula lacrymans var. lacrymans S7.9]EGO24727.1 hypothetical protein SERLADRAFT_468448 [Serpula lacrymans var. lacrymans S7.9]
MKPAVVLWLSELFPTTSSHSPLDTVDKNGRGFAHNLTGYLLCPCEYDWNDNSVKEQIRDRHPKFLVTAMSWPRFLYSKYTNDPEDLEKGFLQGTLLLKAYKFVFTSPTSARDVKDEERDPPPLHKRTKRLNQIRTRGHVASLLGMHSVMPRSIAYIAVQLRFALSNVGSWRSDDGDFDYILF